MSRPPSLYELALLQCQRYATSITDIGDLPYGVVKPWLQKIGRAQLASIEAKSPHLLAHSDELWRDLISRDFRDRPLPRSRFRATYAAYQRDKEAQLGQACERLKMKQEQYNRSKRASSVVALSEAELPYTGGAAPPALGFRSPMMRSVVKRSQAAAVLHGRKPPPRLVPAQPRRAMSPPVAAPGAKLASPFHWSGAPVAAARPLDRGKPEPRPASGVAQLGSPPMSPPLGSPPMSPPLGPASPSASPIPQMPPTAVASPRPPAKRRRVASVFMPRR